MECMICGNDSDMVLICITKDPWAGERGLIEKILTLFNDERQGPVCLSCIKKRYAL